MILKSAGRALAAAALLSAASPNFGHAAGPLPPGTPSDIFATGGEVIADYIGFDAILYSELWFFGSMYPASLTTPTGGSFLFHNNGSVGASLSMHSGSAFADPASLGTFAMSDKLIFGLYVPEHDRWFYTGTAGYNPDTNIHAKLTMMGPKALEVGFEDLCRGGYDASGVCSGERYVSDWDYNDHVFQLSNATTAPEPISMALLGTGLAGMAGVARRRRRQNADLAS